MYLREGARLALSQGNRLVAAIALLNLSNMLNIDQPSAAIEPSREAFDIFSEIGDRFMTSVVIANTAWSQLALGDWDAAEESLTRLPPPLLGQQLTYLTCAQAFFAGLRGDPERAAEVLSRVEDGDRADDRQKVAAAAAARAFIAHARGDNAVALDHALDCIEAFRGIAPFGGDDGRWTWPLAARSAHELGRFDLEESLAVMCEELPRGEPAPMQRAEAALIRARLVAVGHDRDDDPDALFETAIAALRDLSTPYHLAHGLLDHAAHLVETGRSVDELVDEARAIGERLGCRPLCERAARVASIATARSA
jgi:hypothetical protein